MRLAVTAILAFSGSLAFSGDAGIVKLASRVPASQRSPWISIDLFPIEPRTRSFRAPTTTVMSLSRSACSDGGFGCSAGVAGLCCCSIAALPATFRDRHGLIARSEELSSLGGLASVTLGESEPGSGASASDERRTPCPDTAPTFPWDIRVLRRLPLAERTTRLASVCRLRLYVDSGTFALAASCGETICVSDQGTAAASPARPSEP
mmetsp:Transcript_1971/g.5849  ORF Transcript_1971/g.5849 Transcript_1971/m.5849 type:complete len:207 (+) Transcript_1971:345-965(+)